MRPVDVLESSLIAPPPGDEDREEVRFEIAAAAGEVTEAPSAEPRFADALVLEFEEPERLDPARAAADPEAPPPTPSQTASRLGMAYSVGVHLLPLLFLALAPPFATTENAAPIPVQLVTLKEPEPPPPPPPKPPPEAKPPSGGRLASVAIGDPTAPPRPKAADVKPDPEPPKETKVAAAPPRPTPPQPSELVSALPKPAPKPEPDLKPAEPEPETLDLAKPALARPAPKAHPTPHHGDVPGPSASRSEYLVYCMSLVRQHYGLLPASFLAGRRGLTVVNILVRADGTIARVEVVRHSGYADIDGRVEQMIAAVHRFPPLPQWIQRPSITMTYELAFPEGLNER